MTKLDLIFFSQSLVSDFKKYQIDLDYSIDSLAEIEAYLTKLSSNGEVQKNAFLSEDVEAREIALGAYTGEVIRRNGDAIKWDNLDTESPWEISLTMPNGSSALPINKAYKRIQNGAEDNLHHFASAMLNKYMKYEGEPPEDFYDQDDLRIIQYGNSPLVIYSKAIANNDGIVYHIYHEEGQWFFTGMDEEEGQIEGDRHVFRFLEEVKADHPEFAHLLKAENKLRVVRQDDGSYRSQKAHSGLFFDSHTIPSYQGDMNLNFLQWTKYNLGKVAKLTLALVAGLLLTIKVHWLFAIVLIGALLYNIWYWFTAYNRFKGGDVNPGRVISLEPTLVAVATDMRKYSGDYPILKIIKTKLPKEDRKLGKIIPTVAIYNDNPHGYPFWSEFHPVPVIHGLKDQNHIDHMLATISQTSIQNLHDYIGKTSSKAPGIYKVDEHDSNWSAYPHVDLSKGVSMEGPIGPAAEK